MDSEHKIADIVRRIDALGVLPELVAPLWAFCPHGSIFPYFCAVAPLNGRDEKGRITLLEGWQTFHEYNIWVQDNLAGFLTNPIELPAFNVLMLRNGGASAIRQTPGYFPQPVSGRQADMVADMLWETFGVLMRFEEDRKLPFRYIDDGCMFSRRQLPSGEWEDAPLKVVPPHRLAESVRLPKDDLRVAKDLPMLKDRSLRVEFGLDVTRVSADKERKFAYVLKGIDEKGGETLFDVTAFVHPPERMIRDIWQEMPSECLRQIVALGFVPSEIRVGDMRLFRLLRPLTIELPFRLVLNQKSA